MPVLGCGAEMAKLMDVSDNDVSIIEETIAERLELGVSQAVAQRQAVDEALAQLREERAMVMKAIDEQLGKEVVAETEPVVEPEPEPVAQDDLQNVEVMPEDGSVAEVAPEPPAQPTKPKTLLSSITAAIDKAYPNLRTKLEAKGLLTIGQTLDEITTAAAQARADKTGESLEAVKASMMGEVSNSTVWHGSPTEFDKFDSTKIGTGNGAQAYGNGTYFSESPTVAGSYALINATGPAKVANMYKSDGRDEVMRQLKSLYPNKSKKWYESAINESETTGNLYKVDLPDSEIDKMIDWDKPLSEQPKFVKDALSKSKNASIKKIVSGVSLPSNFMVPASMRNQPKTMGENITLLGEPSDTSDLLSKLGITGIRYQEAGTNNFVVFPGKESVLSILERNSLQIKRSSNGDIQGFFDPVTGKSFLIADNLTEQSAPGVLIHEVGIHMANDGTLEPVFNQALRLLKMGKGNPWFDGVRARLESSGETSGEEAAAYITETIENDRAAAPASVMKWFNDFKAAIKAWLFKKGVFISSEDLNAADIAAIARANAKQVGEDGASESMPEGEVAFSKAGAPPAPGSWDAPLPNSKVGRYLESLQQMFQDGKLDLKRIQKAITNSGKTIGEAFDARLAETLYAGRVATRADNFMKSEAEPLLAAMAKNNVSQTELSDYLLARHAPERNAQIAKVNDKFPDGGAGTNSKGVLMTTQAANDYIANLSAGHKILMPMLAKKVDAISKGTRDLLVSEGLETQEMIDAWQGAYTHYVPLFKDEANGESFAPHPVGSGFSVKGGASKRSTGSDAEVTNMLSHLLLQREAAITRAEKNRVGMALYGLALTQPNGDFWTTIKPAMKKADVEASLTAMGIDPATYDEMDLAPMVKTISKTTGKVVMRPNPLYKNLDNAIVLKVEGQDRVIMFNQNNERAMRLVQNLKNLDGVTGIDGAMRIIGKPTRWISSLATQYNPAFGLVNLLRDTQGALVNLSSTKLAGKQLQVLAGMPAAIRGIASGLNGGTSAMAKLYEQFKEDGGQTGYRDAMRDPKERTQQIEKDLKHLADTGKLTARNAALGVLNLLDGFNTTLENGTRLSAYKVALDNGMSRPQAARLARELTVDFNRKGSLGTTVGPMYAFFNAAVQGTSRTVETLKGPAGKKIIAGGLALGVLQALMLAAAGYDDDEIAEFAKARALIIPRFGEDKKYISIALPLGLHVLPNTGRVLTELAMTQGKDWGEKLYTAVGEIAGAFNPLGGGNVFTTDGLARTIAPTVIDPLVDLATGKDFSGRPISKMSMPGDPRPGYLRGRESTYRAPSGEVYTGISKALNTLSGGDDFRKGKLDLTPEESRYLVMTIGGGLLREIEKTINASIMASRGDDVPTRQIPIGSRFAGEVDDASVQHTRYYKNSSKVAALEAELKALAKEGRSEEVDKLIADKPLVTLYKLNDRVGQSIAKLNKLASGNLGDKETMKSLDDARTENMRILNEAVKELERASAQ